MDAPKPGIYPGVPFEEYLRWPCVHATLLEKVRARTPAHGRYWEDHPGDPTPALRFGTLLHRALLEPDRFKKSVKALPADAPRRPTDSQRNAAKPSESTIASIAFWDEWEADGRETIKAEELTAIQAMCASVRSTQCRQYTTGGHAEVSMVWIDRITGLPCKLRIDYLQQQVFGSVINDIKTCLDASEKAFRKAIFFYGYFLQAAFYVDGFMELTGDMASFNFIAIEKDPPYCAKAYQLDDQSLQAGRNAYRAALDIWAQCVKKNDYPAYGPEINLIGLERWQLESCGVGPHQVYAEPIASAEPIGVEAFTELYGLNEDEEHGGE